MKKFLFILVLGIICLNLSSCLDETGSNETRAGIIAEDFVKNEVLSPSDLVYETIGVDKTGDDTYHVVAQIKTMNGLGMMVPRKVSVRLRYNGEGDWTDIYNWTKISIRFLNESTGMEESL